MPKSSLSRHSKRSKRNRLNPIQSNQTVAESIPILPIVSKLQGADANERAWAATAVSNLIMNDDMRKDLLNSNLLTTLMHLLADPNNEVVIEACGALRNLALVGGDQVCLDLLNAGILNTLILLFQKLNHHFNNVKLNLESKEMDIKSTFLLAEQLISLIWSFVELSNDALTRCAGLLPIMQDLIFYPETPFSTKYMAAQCIMTVTEENADIVNLIEKNRFQGIVLDTTAHNSLRLVSIGILLNCLESGEPNVDLYFSIIQEALSADVSEIIAKAIKSAGLITQNEQDSMEEQDLKKSLDKNNTVLETQITHLSYLQLTLEILSMLFYESGEWEEENDMDMDPMDPMDMNQINRYAQQFLTLGLLKPLIGMLSLQVECEENQIIKPFSYEWDIVKIRICGALNNLFCCFDKETLPQTPEYFVTVWNDLIACNYESMVLDLKTDFMDNLWSLVRLMDISWISNSNPSVQFIQEIMQLFQSSTIGESPRLACIGVLGFLAQAQGNISLNLKIGAFLMSVLFESSCIQEKTQVLNELFDIYADASFDYNLPVFVEQGFLDKLLEFSHHYENQISSIKNNPLEYGRAEEAFMNLNEFIKYKRQEL